jgi:hypothetical protein
MSDRGVFGVDRGIFEHHWLSGEPYTRIQAWAWLCKEAAYKPRRKYVAGVWVDLERRQLAHSLRFMAEKWQWSEKRVRTFIRRCMEDGMIEIGLKKGTARGTGITVITVCNYDEYQIVGLPKDAPLDAAETQPGHKQEEGKKERERDTRARVSQSLISPEAHALADECRKAVGATEDEYSGLAYQAQVWCERGFMPAQVLAAFVALVDRHGPGKPMSYLNKAIETACTQRAPPPPPRELPLLTTIENRGHADARQPAIRTTNFATFAADLRKAAAARNSDSAA